MDGVQLRAQLLHSAGLNICRSSFGILLTETTAVTTKLLAEPAGRPGFNIPLDTPHSEIDATLSSIVARQCDGTTTSVSYIDAQRRSFRNGSFALSAAVLHRTYEIDAENFGGHGKPAVKLLSTYNTFQATLRLLEHAADRHFLLFPLNHNH